MIRGGPLVENETTRLSGWMIDFGSYTGGRLGHATHDGDVPGIDLGLTHLLGVGVEPQVVGTVGSQIVLISSQVQVPHPFCFLSL